MQILKPEEPACEEEKKGLGTEALMISNNDRYLHAEKRYIVIKVFVRRDLLLPRKSKFQVLCMGMKP